MSEGSGLPFTIVVDDRERRAGWTWPGCQHRRLETGDYMILQSLAADEKLVTIERKTKEDLYGCVTESRSRFKRELERLKEFAFAAVVVECTLIDFMTPIFHRQLHPSAALGSVVSWEIRHGIPFHFAGGKASARMLAERILRKCWDNREALLERCSG